MVGASAARAGVVVNPVYRVSPLGPPPLAWDEVWAAREVLYSLVLREVRLRYRQTYLGIAWALLQPLVAMALFSLFFGKFARLPSDGIPYPVFALAGLLPWQLFSFVLTLSARSLLANQALVNKVYFPRVLLPLSTLVAALIDFFIPFILLMALIPLSGLSLTLKSLWGVVFVAHAALAAFAGGLWISALTVRYRDLHHAVPFLIQVLFFTSPVAYGSTLVPETYRAWFAVNPLVGAIDGIRWAFLGASAPSPLALGVSVASTFAFVMSGWLYFRQIEKKVDDYL